MAYRANKLLTVFPYKAIFRTWLRTFSKQSVAGGEFHGFQAKLEWRKGPDARWSPILLTPSLTLVRERRGLRSSNGRVGRRKLQVELVSWPLAIGF